jgi:MFS family permease
MIMQFIGGLIWTFLPIILYQNGFSFFEIAIFFAVTAFPALFMEFTVGKYVDDFGVKKAIVIGLFLNMIAVAILAMNLSLYAIYLSAIIGGFSWIFFKISAQTFVTNMVIGKVEGMLTGFMTQFSDVGMFFGALLGGFLFISYSTSMVFTMCVGVLFIGVIISLFLPRTVVISKIKT